MCAFHALRALCAGRVPRRRGSRRSLCGAVLLAAAMTASVTSAVTSVAGCGGGCVPTRLELTPPASWPQEGTVTLRARLTRQGRPLAGAPVELAIGYVSVNGAHGSAGRTVTTDADGVAFLTARPDVLLYADDRPRAVEASFTTWNRLDGVDYCWSKASVPLPR
ncbi:hypothetical protein HII36_55030 [Nonomuraea sp. NN258]|uniref:hypothetical protein n=1 Tax=Nonomuraea antri TaxID=2730852 RepID=UPI0015698EAE|nr:hypothetical protein [Nonomuraea antri]NRQ40864.1 hypothetical protein [Nonomuraea antri]